MSDDEPLGQIPERVSRALREAESGRESGRGPQGGLVQRERLGPPPVEPLSDAAWSRVERSVWSHLDAVGASRGEPTPVTSRRWWLAVPPLVAAAAAAVIVVGVRTSTIEVADEPSRVVSGSGPSSVSFGDSHIELEANSAVAMSHEAGHPVTLLERGAAWFTVAPRLSRPEFIVRAGDAAVRVVGTRFRVARSEERIEVDVEHGVVDVQFRGRMAAIGAKQRWSSESPGRIATTTGATAAGAATHVASVAPTGTAEPMPVAVPAPVSGTRQPAASLPTAVSPSPAAKPSAKAALRTEPNSEPAPVGGVAIIDRDRAEYDRLAALEPRDPEAALTGYLALTRGTSRWADPALFAAARLAADRHDRRAETLLGIYLQRFPSGANATDAKKLLVRLKEDHP